MLKKNIKNVNNMTICVAGICNYKREEETQTREGIVFATDHMVSIEGLGQFEHKIRKYEMLENGMVIMLAGAISLDDVVDGLSLESKSFGETALILRNKMKRLRDQKIETEILSRIGLSFGELKEIAKGEIKNEFIHELIQKVLVNPESEESEGASLDSQIMLIGFEENKAKLATITEFNIVSMRELGFAAIGSGWLQAVNALLFQKHSKEENLFTAIYNIHKAKKNAEVAEGVGKTTDLFILLDNGNPLPIENLKILDEIYSDELEFGKKHPKLQKIFGVPEDVKKEEKEKPY